MRLSKKWVLIPIVTHQYSVNNLIFALVSADLLCFEISCEGSMSCMRAWCGHPGCSRQVLVEMGTGQIILMAAGVMMITADDLSMMAAGVMLMAADVMLMAADEMLMAAGVMLMAADVMVAADVLLMAGGVLMAAGVMMAADVDVELYGAACIVGLLVAVGEANEVACSAMETVGGEWMVGADDCYWSWMGQMVPIDDCDDRMEVVGKMCCVWKASPFSLHLIVLESLFKSHCHTCSTVHRYWRTPMSCSRTCYESVRGFRLLRWSPIPWPSPSMTFFTHCDAFALRLHLDRKRSRTAPSGEEGPQSCLKSWKILSQGSYELTNVTIAFSKWI